ncbi:hypothetical protein K523DRAFT_417757 [Schizophyllum commune Tattone D]|nr:hypothetical protein K523DRAFT_417757 [Schizophyllum commune Tattone D]
MQSEISFHDHSARHGCLDWSLKPPSSPRRTHRVSLLLMLDYVSLCAVYAILMYPYCFSCTIHRCLLLHVAPRSPRR